MAFISDENTDSYEEYVDPQQDTGSTLSKGVWQAVSTLGLFVIGQALATKGIRGGAQKLFSSLAVAHRQPHIRKAAKYALEEQGGSIAAFLSRTNSRLQPLAATIQAASTNTAAMRVQSSWKEQGLSAYEKFQQVKKIAGISRGSDVFTRAGLKTVADSDFRPVINKIGADYLKETALNLPLFYGMMTYSGEHQGDAPAWYNVPGHVVGMAKYAPEYFLFDGVFRGASKLFGVAKGAIGARIGDSLPNPIKRGLSSALSRIQAGEYLGARVGGITLGHWTSEAKASASAFADTWGPNRKRYWKQVSNTLSMYKRTDNSFADLLQDKKNIYREKRKDHFGVNIERIKTRALQQNLKSKDAADHYFKNILNTLRDDFNRMSERGSGVREYEVPTKLFNKAYFQKDKSVPFLAKLLGIRQATGKDFGGAKKLSRMFVDGKGDDLFDRLAQQSGNKLLGKTKSEFFDQILAKNAYVNKSTGVAIDLEKANPRFLLNKLAHSQSLVLFGKVSLADLFGLKLFTSRPSDLPRIIPVKGPVAVDKSSFVKGITPNLNEHGLWMPQSQRGLPGTALLVRSSGEKKYSLYDFDRTQDLSSDSWTKIASNIRTGLASNSSKAARVFTRSVIDTQGTTTPPAGYSENPLIGFMQKHLSILDGSGESMSVFQRARTFLPKGINDFISPPGGNIYNDSRSISVLKNIRTAALRAKEAGYTDSTIFHNEVQRLASRINSLGNKASTESFDKILSDDLFMNDIVDFVIKKGNVKGLSGFKSKDVLTSNEKLVDFARRIISHDSEFKGFLEHSGESINQILSGARLSPGALDPRGGKGTPVKKIKKFIYDFAVDKSQGQRASDNIIDILQGSLTRSATKRGLIAEGRFAEKDLAELEYALIYQRHRSTLSSPKSLHNLSAQELKALPQDQQDFMKTRNLSSIVSDMLDRLGQTSTFINNGETIVDNYAKSVGHLQLMSSLGTSPLSHVVGEAVASNPVVLYPGGMGGAAKLGMLWTSDTMRKIGEVGGLGWDPYRYKGTDLAKLWGKRVAAFGAANIGYSTLDTFVDVSGLFDWSAFDEGVTVGLADQAVRARMAAGWAYDKLGVDNMARYMEGLMPGSTSVIPGAAMGLFMGGLKGAAVGGLLNAAIQPQAAEGPLSFLSILPPLAPFVTDMTKDFSELQDIYEGNTLIARKKGAGWCLTPDDRVQTNYGHYVPADAVKVKDRLVGSDGKTHEVSQILTREIDESIVQLKPHHTYISPKLTKQHPVLTSLDTEELKWKEAGKINEEDWLVYKKPYAGGRSKNLRLLHFLDEKLPYLIEGEGPKSKITLLQPRTTKNRSKNTYSRKGATLPGEFHTDYDLGLFLGWFMAEGTIQHNGKYLIEATYSAKEQYWVDSIITYLKETWKVRKVTIESPSPKGTVNIINGKESISTGQTRRIRFSSVELWSIIKKLCYRDTKKYNNPVFLSFGKDFLKAFLVGWFYGDGHFTKNKKDQYTSASFTSATEQHILQLWNMLLVFDMLGYLYKRNEGQSYRVMINAKQLQRFLDLGATKHYTEKGCKLQERSYILRDTFHIKKGRVFIKIKSSEQIHYTGLVYDYTVEDSHNFSLEQFIVHNSLGNTPIAGGRIEGYEPNWYARVKSQYKAGPSLYGSKIEQFLFKDIPLLDVSLGDILDPNYLEWKHYKDRPYSIPSAPFEEAPVVGPILGATVGRLINALHPLGSNLLHKDEGERAYMSGTTYDWKGNKRQTFGPQFGGFAGASNPQNIFAGNQGNASPLLSPHTGRALISEQVYRSIIEPPGLPGFITSATLWGGDEPYADTPVLASASSIDSFTRTFWDQNLGDMLGTNEGLRRLIPRKRTSVEEVNFLQNNMPSWMGGDLRCISKDTVVEIDNKHKRADTLNVGDRVRTHKGTLSKITGIQTRTMDEGEKLYSITVNNLPHISSKVSEEHPFWTPKGWKEIKDLEEADYVGYPIPTLSTLLEKDTIIDVTEYVTDFRYDDAFVYSSGHASYKMPRYIDINSSSFGIIQGYFVAEGCTSGLQTMDIALHKRELEYSKELRAAFLEVFLYELRDREQEPVIRWSAYSTLIAKFFRSFFGSSCKNKRMYLTDLNWKDSLRTLMNGDGCFFVNYAGQHQASFTQPHNPDLRYQLWQVLLAHGIVGADNGKSLVYRNKQAEKLAELLNFNKAKKYLSIPKIPNTLIDLKKYTDCSSAVVTDSYIYNRNCPFIPLIEYIDEHKNGNPYWKQGEVKRVCKSLGIKWKRNLGSDARQSYKSLQNPGRVLFRIQRFQNIKECEKLANNYSTVKMLTNIVQNLRKNNLIKQVHKKEYYNSYWYIENGYWYTRISKKREIPQELLYSINVAGDHSFCLPGVATHNSGDPYCLTPDTLVETLNGLVAAKDIKKDDLLKTIYGRYFPVQGIKTRQVDEDIYKITVEGLEDFPLSVTGGHPFYINEQWVFAKDIKITDKVTYPLVSVDTPTDYHINSTTIPVNGVFAYTLGLLARWLTGNTFLVLRREIPHKLKQELESLLYDIFGISLVDLNTVPELVELIISLQQKGPSIVLFNKDLPIILNYLKPFLVSSETDNNIITFRMHTKEAAYFVWSSLIQNKIASRVEDRDILIDSLSAAEVAFCLNIDLDGVACHRKWPRTEDTIEATFDPSKWTTKHGSIARLSLMSIEKYKYNGPVYAIDMGEDESFTIPGALVHNSKVAHGELLLPGDAYESFFNPDITFPTGMSRLGYSPYDQALSMVGLGEFSLETQDTLEEGSAIHKMVQDQLINAGLATRVEALISDPEMNVRSYVDVMYRDPYSNKELPLEIKSISAMGLAGLKQPKWKHRVQVNAYMAAMNVQSGKFLYVARDDPSQTKQFSIRFDPKLWEKTKSDLREARSLASDFLRQGYGSASKGYSYIDRMRVLLNTAPYSTEFRETDTLLKEQLEKGILNPEQEEEYSTLQKYHRSLMRKHELYPHRFKVTDLLNPSEEYPEELSSNLFIKPASDYSAAERVIGSAWEYATHLNSPIHTKLIGHYSPEEQYRRSMIRGDFASWTSPIEDFVKPYARGLRSSADPLQGAISWGTGGTLVAGLPGAVAGAAIGAAYGAFNGAYEMMTGNRYMPEEFRDRVNAQTYFDMLNYYKAQQLYNATGDKAYEKQMRRTPYGWVTATMEGHWSPQGRMAAQGRKDNNPYTQGVGTDMGFGSPWLGIDKAVKVREGYVRLFRGLKQWKTGQIIQKGRLMGSAKYDGALFTSTSHTKALRYAGDSGYLIEMHVPEKLAADYLYGSKVGFKELQSHLGRIDALKLAQSTKGRIPLDVIFKEGLEKKYLQKVWSSESYSTKLLKKVNSPSALNIGPDKGFGSPWQGMDNQQALDFQTNLLKYTGFGALPSWDRPFWSAFLETPESKREQLLTTVDDQMSNMLLTAWGRGEEVSLPSPDTFFNTHYKPPNLHPVMDPTQDIKDFQTITLQEEGLDAHDFGMGWRDQLRKIANNPISIMPIDMTSKIKSKIRGNLGKAEMEDAIRKVLNRMGYFDSTVNVTIQNSSMDETVVYLNVARAATSQIIEKMHG